ncbi:MAG: hypothetical protein IH627_19340 [Rubrivivax sp.]|nr:hypothetical protein [Rubrivivax sp.]
MTRAAIVAQVLLVAALLVPGAVRSEPYLAVRAGVKCMVCHVNPTGGGKRTDFGASYGQTALAGARINLAAREVVATDAAGASAPWTGRLSDWFALGADLRATTRRTQIPGSSETVAFNQTRAQVYLEVKPLGDLLTLYADERVAPGDAVNREAYALLWLADHRAYLKAGRMFVPFGLRIEDDSAFIRQVSGVNFNSSDRGIEGGLEFGPWSASVALTRPVTGGADRPKPISAIATYVEPNWRVGLSLSRNTGSGADRRMQSAFGGLRTGIVSWLAAAVYVTEEGTPIGRLEQWASLVEGNVEFAKGHNLKLTLEHYDPNVDVPEDHRERYSAVWEYMPFQFTQLRLGLRKNSGIPQNKPQNAREWFAQWHAFF